MVKPAVAVAMPGTTRSLGMTWAIVAQICGEATAAATPAARRSPSMEVKDQASPVAAVATENAAIPATRTRRRSSRSEAGPATRAALAAQLTAVEERIERLEAARRLLRERLDASARSRP